MDLLIENARLVSMERGEAGYLPTPPAVLVFKLVKSRLSVLIQLEVTALT